MPFGPCVVTVKVISPSPGSASATLGSIGTAASRWFATRTETDDVGALEHGGVVAEVERERDVGAVLVEEHRRAVEHGGLGVDDDGQRVVVDDHGLGGVDGLRAGLGDHRGHDVADEAHHALGQRRPVEHRRQHDEALDVGELRGCRSCTRRPRRASPRPRSCRSSDRGVGDGASGRTPCARRR